MNNLIEYMRNNVLSKSQFTSLDPTTPWYEYLSYEEVCNSLNIRPRLGGFMRYNAYLKYIGVIQ
jgi:hypothetical protein